MYLSILVQPIHNVAIFNFTVLPSFINIFFILQFMSLYNFSHHLLLANTLDSEEHSIYYEHIGCF